MKKWYISARRRSYTSDSGLLYWHSSHSGSRVATIPRVLRRDQANRSGPPTCSAEERRQGQAAVATRVPPFGVCQNTISVVAHTKRRLALL